MSHCERSEAILQNRENTGRLLRRCAPLCPAGIAMTAEGRFMLLTGKISASAFPVLGKGSLRIGKDGDDVEVYNY
jgi:hypothetical protein